MLPLFVPDHCDPLNVAEVLYAKFEVFPCRVGVQSVQVSHRELISIKGPDVCSGLNELTPNTAAHDPAGPAKRRNFRMLPLIG